MPAPIRGGGITSCAGGRHNMSPPPVTLTLKVVSESRVPISVLLGLCFRLVRDVRCTRQTDVRQHHRLIPRLGGGAQQLRCCHDDAAVKATSCSPFSSYRNRFTKVVQTKTRNSLNFSFFSISFLLPILRVRRPNDILTTLLPYAYTQQTLTDITVQ